MYKPPQEEPLLRKMRRLPSHEPYLIATGGLDNLTRNSTSPLWKRPLKQFSWWMVRENRGF